jgi:hypothetical protein
LHRIFASAIGGTTLVTGMGQQTRSHLSHKLYAYFNQDFSYVDKAGFRFSDSADGPALLELGSYKVYIMVYGFVLALNVFVGAYNLNYRNRSHDLFFFFCVTSFIFTDVSYLITEYFYSIELLNMLNFILQLFGYYFVVRYFILKEK